MGLCLIGCSHPVLQTEKGAPLSGAVQTVIEPFPEAIAPEQPIPAPSEPAALIPPVEAPLPVRQTRIEQKLNGNMAMLPVVRGEVLLRDVSELKSFYGGRAWQPAWFDGDMPSTAVAVFLKVLGKAEEEGLSSGDYHYEEIKNLLGALGAGPDERAAVQADLDILLTDAYRAYAAHLYAGKIEPGRVSNQWPVQKKYDPKIPELQEIPPADRLEKTLLSLPPPYLGYRQLRDLLAKYRRIEAAGGWPVIPGGKLAPGQRNARVAALKQRLFLSGELPAMPAKNRDLYDASLEKACGCSSGRTIRNRTALQVRPHCVF